MLNDAALVVPIYISLKEGVPHCSKMSVCSLKDVLLFPT